MPPAESKAKPTLARDPISHELLRPLDIADAIIVANEQSKREERNELRVGASELGKCLRELYWRKLGVEPDPGESWEMDLGIAERGHATEARVLHWLREAHGENRVLQDLPLSKWFDIPHPETGENVRVAISTLTDPVVIGDNLKVLALHEIKSKDNVYFFPKVQKKWASDPIPKYKWTQDEPTKVPLFMFQVEDKANGIEGASTHNLLQAATEARILREHEREPSQVLLTYILPGNLRIHLTAVLSKSDVDVLSELAFLWLRQFFHYWLKKEVPPALFTMNWQCSLCPVARRCNEENQKTGQERGMNPLFVGLNERLEKARKAKESEDLTKHRLALANAKVGLAAVENGARAAHLADLPVSTLIPKSKGAK